jgi:hypothetical protein
VSGVVAGQVRVGLGVPEIVDRDELQIVPLAAFIMGSQDISADAAVAVYCHSNRHRSTPRSLEP